MHPVPGGYIIRPYGVDVGVCSQRTAPDPGAGGPMWASALTRRTIEPQWKSGVCPGGHTGRPYEEAEGGSVGADLYPPMQAAALDAPSLNAPIVGADAHIGPLGIDIKSTTVERTYRRGAHGASGTGCDIRRAGGRCTRFRADI